MKSNSDYQPKCYHCGLPLETADSECDICSLEIEGIELPKISFEKVYLQEEGD